MTDDATKMKQERDLALAECERLRADAQNYLWLQERFLGADFDWNETGQPVLVFEIPSKTLVYGDLNATIDAARAKP